MSDLTPLTALGGAEPARLTLGALTLTENADLALASLALRRDSIVGSGRPAPLGLDLPDPGGWVGLQGVGAFWTSPGQWMIEAEEAAGGDFAALVKTAAPDCSVTEQTDAWVAFEVTSSQGAGPLVGLLEKLANLDADLFGPGQATRTAIEHMSCYIIRRAEDRLAILGMRTLANSLWHTLTQAASRLQRAA
ncbi:sarcosine oxidase subunit gamma [Rhodospirillum sp. A1_3_36]|uniref:sarcosine oxidase subunit gamma n=1 Tax=Rhodospirillum sp. A1_3_36 TaxID=3391666 RepID=UPI0039A510A6